MLYYKHGYRETEVDTTVTRLNDKQVAVRFDIREGPPTLVTGVTVAVRLHAAASTPGCGA